MHFLLLCLRFTLCYCNHFKPGHWPLKLQPYFNMHQQILANLGSVLSLKFGNYQLEAEILVNFTNFGICKYGVIRTHPRLNILFNHRMNYNSCFLNCVYFKNVSNCNQKFTSKKIALKTIRHNNSHR